MKNPNSQGSFWNELVTIYRVAWKLSFQTLVAFYCDFAVISRLPNLVRCGMISTCQTTLSLSLLCMIMRKFSIFAFCVCVRFICVAQNLVTSFGFFLWWNFFCSANLKAVDLPSDKCWIVQFETRFLEEKCLGCQWLLRFCSWKCLLSFSLHSFL